MDGGAPFKFMHYTPRLGGWKRELPIMVHSLTETSILYPDVPHSWLCDGRLLRLHDTLHKGNLQIFQEQWKRGQPVLVSCANKALNMNLWKPEVFSKEFGHIGNEVVNTRNGDVIIGHTMADFWDGFEYLESELIFIPILHLLLVVGGSVFVFWGFFVHFFPPQVKFNKQNPEAYQIIFPFLSLLF